MFFDFEKEEIRYGLTIKEPSVEGVHEEWLYNFILGR